MFAERPLFTICIPAYNRARHLPSLLDSILRQDCQDFQILICEDLSSERTQIAEIARDYQARHPGKLIYVENIVNLGYDANIRNLVAQAAGQYCFFMGNDDIMCGGVLSHAKGLIQRYPDVGMVLKSYAWFDETPDHINQEVRYFDQERFFHAGLEAIGVCFRRAGVISGFIIHRDQAHAASTAEFDGTLYYQMHLTGSVLASMNAVATPKVLVLCRNGEPPEFGNSASEKGKYTPGTYSPQARLNMVSGAIAIARNIEITKKIAISESIIRDYANYFYPYIKDQLNLPIKDFIGLHKKFSEMGFGKYPLFHLYFLVGYILKENRFDALTRIIRRILGRSPHFGISSK